MGALTGKTGEGQTQAPGEGDTTPAALGQQGLNAMQHNADSAGGKLAGSFQTFLSHVLLILSKLDGFKNSSWFSGYFYFAQEILYPPCRFLKDHFPLSS